jgi:hypothetical protein
MGVNITIQDGGLNQKPPGTDHITGIVSYSDDASTFAYAGYGSVAEVLAGGITATVAPHANHILTKQFFPKAAEVNGTAPQVYFSSHAVPAGAHDFAEILAMCRAANGNIKQVVVYTEKTFAAAQIGVLQGICNTLATESKPIVAVLAYGATEAYASATNLVTSGTSKNVAVINARGTNALALPPVGQTAALLAVVDVATSIGQVGGTGGLLPCNLDQPNDEVTKLGDGTLINTLSDATLTTLSNKGYLVPVAEVGVAGHYYMKDITATAATSDFNRIRRNRVINKASRLIKAAGVLRQNSKLLLDSNSKLRKEAIGDLEGVFRSALQPMVVAEEISAFGVAIPPDQTVTDSEIDITVKIIEVSTGEEINIILSYALTLS